MNQEEFQKIIEKKEIERKGLEGFLKSRILDPSTLREIMQPNYETFEFELCKMVLFLEEAKKAADKGEVEETVHILGAGARVQKDVVYGVMFRIFGINLESSYSKSLRDYVMNKYQKEERKCLEIIKRQVVEELRRRK